MSALTRNNTQPNFLKLARFLQDFQEFQDSNQELQETLRPCSSSSRFQRQTSLATKSVLGSYANNLDKQLNTWTDLTTKRQTLAVQVS